MDPLRTALDGTEEAQQLSDGSLCVCGRPKDPYHTDRPTAPGTPWHPYTVPTGRHERGCLAVSGSHDAALCGRLWEKDGNDDTREAHHE